MTNDSHGTSIPADVLAWVQQTQPPAKKRANFFRRLLPLLEFGREREGVDLSKGVLTHHKLKN